MGQILLYVTRNCFSPKYQCDKLLCVSPLSVLKYMNSKLFEVGELCHYIIGKRQEKSGLGFHSINMFCTKDFGCK